ncbi:DNA repair protein rhp54 [Plakobranchus ocellatus]|uniref:DNA repair protein rhp54 n=1 Tax=Plakobranchus ocellatus TaxID=259542 RepID=A0AAV4DQ57_9GAST|nr:DNA repair protein rhp54 [Plakobranchus ocellatus]
MAAPELKSTAMNEECLSDLEQKSTDSDDSMDVPLVRLAELQKEVEIKRKGDRRAQIIDSAEDGFNKVVTETSKSPTKRKSALAANTAWELSEKEEVGPEYWSDLSLDDSDADPDFSPPKKKRTSFRVTHQTTCSKDRPSALPKTDLQHDQPINAETDMQPSTSSVVNQISELTEEDPEQTNAKKRKRSRDESNWARNKRKQQRNSGQSYTTSRGKQVEARKMTEGCNTGCRQKCHSNFGPEERSLIFNNYWALQNIDLQRQFIASTVTKSETKRSYNNKAGSRRSSTYCYSLLTSGQKQTVCKKFYLATLGIKQDIVFGAIRKVTETGAVTHDQRGAHENHPTLEVHVLQSIKDHIKSFPSVPSHYCRKTSDKQYLEDNLSLATMYRLYKEHCTKEGITCAKEASYKRIFYRDFNIAFHQPKKDQCDECQAYGNITEPTEEQKEQQTAHLGRKERARSYKDFLKSKAKENSHVSSACFDLQQILPCPHGQISSFFYKRKLSVYNLSVYDLATGDVFCNLWSEAISARGANQIASCVLNFIDHQVQKGVSKIHLVSDNCTGQNRNRYMATMLYYAMDNYSSLQELEHCFLERGHTQNENDSVHSVISRAAKNIPIYTPEQWAAVIRGARRGKHPYNVRELTSTDIFDFKQYSASLKNFEKDENDEKVQWMKIKSLCITRDEPNILQIKYDFDQSNTVKVDLFRGRRKSEQAVVQLQILKEKAGVTSAKKADLMSMCNTLLIPRQHHSFFEQLPIVSTE